ncbi:hypothetical protein ATHL_02230 [Anaerolinea thermolimosa]|nr:hypothetical protein ATHL_02230 [Anaerolinea thermolimosa]
MGGSHAPRIFDAWMIRLPVHFTAEQRRDEKHRVGIFWR